MFKVAAKYSVSFVGFLGGILGLLAFGAVRNRDLADGWKEKIEMMGPILAWANSSGHAWIFLVGAGIFFAAAILPLAWPRIAARAKPSQIPAGEPARTAALGIEYDKECHLTKHGNGTVEIRFVVRNAGPETAQRIRIMIISLVALTNKRVAAPYATQFNGLPLQVVRKDRDFELHAGELAEVVFVRSLKNDEHFFVDGYSVDGKQGTFRTPKAKYRVTLAATSLNAEADTQIFEITPRKGGSVTFARV